MAKSQYQSAYNDWSQRIQRYQQAGIPSSVYLPIANRDLSRVYQQGSSTMTNADADTAIYAAWKGANPISETPRHHSGLFGALETVAANVVPDVGNIITGLIRVPQEIGKDIASPKRWEETGHALGSFEGDITTGHVGQALRDLASSHQLSLIPGLADAAALTTEQGRVGLEEHPVTALLDVAPTAAGKALGAGARALGAEAEAGGVSGALASGQPLRAAARGVDQALQSRLGDTMLGQRAALEGRGPLGQLGAEALTKLKMDQNSQFALKFVTRMGQLGNNELQMRLANEIAPVLAPLGDDLKARADWMEKAQVGNVKDMTPVERGVYQQAMALQKKFMDETQGEIVNTPAGPLPIDSPVVRKMRDRERHISNANRAENEYIGHANRLGYAKGELQRLERVQLAKATDKARKGVEKANASEEYWHKRATASWKLAQKHPDSVELRKFYDDDKMELFKAELRLKDAKATLKNPKVEVTGEMKTLGRVVGKLQTQSNRSLADLKKHSNLAKIADRRMHQRIVRTSGTGVSATYHPLIREELRTRLHNALEKQMVNKGKNLEDQIDVEDLPEGIVLHSYQEAFSRLKSPDGATLSEFKAYIGDKEFKAIFSDSVHEALNMVKGGISPLYFHTPHTDSIDRLLNIKISGMRDTIEAQAKTKLFNYDQSMLDPVQGMTGQAAEITRRRTNQQIYEGVEGVAKGGSGGFASHMVQWKDISKDYRKAAESLKQGRSKHKYAHISVGELQRQLIEKDYVKFNFEQYGIRRIAQHKAGDMYLPRPMAEVLDYFNSEMSNTKADKLLQSSAYRATMKVFRTSVLWGPRHFVHVVIGGLTALMLSDPSAILEFGKVAGPVWGALHGKEMKPITLNGKEVTLPQAFATHFNYETDAGAKIFQQKSGNTMARWMKESWAGKGLEHFNQRMKMVEDFAQSMYQASVYAHHLHFNPDATGEEAMHFLEHARDMTVNMDGMTPFERTILKQVFPFYSFTRFAVKYLTRLPFDHPLRIAVLSQMSLQAQEEWGTGLPQTMMSLLFMGHPNAAGNIMTMNFRNVNPFRSVSSMFTIAGFVENMNPILQAPFVAMGYNPLSGSGPLYPQVTFDAQTGSLQAVKPKGDLFTAAEQFVPELGGLDAIFGISSNLRTLKATDTGAFDRQLLNMFNIPLAVSSYNIPQERGRVAEDALKGAQNAVTQYRKTGNYADTIGRFALVPYNGSLYTPQQFANYWDQVVAQAKQIAPGAAPSAVIAKPNAPSSSQTLSELINYYNQ